MTSFQVFQITPQGEDVTSWDFTTYAAAEAHRDRKAMEDFEAGGSDTFAVFDEDGQELDHDPADDLADDSWDDDQRDDEQDATRAAVEISSLQPGTPVRYATADSPFSRTGTITAVDGDTAVIAVDGHPTWRDRMPMASLHVVRQPRTTTEFTPTAECPF